MSGELTPAQLRAIRDHLNSQQTGSRGFESPTPGMMSVWSGTAAPPSGYLLCNGQAVSRSQFIALFTVLGTSHGAGDGTTTFNVPNLAAPGAGMVWVVRS